MLYPKKAPRWRMRQRAYATMGIVAQKIVLRYKKRYVIFRNVWCFSDGTTEVFFTIVRTSRRGRGEYLYGYARDKTLDDCKRNIEDVVSELEKNDAGYYR